MSLLSTKPTCNAVHFSATPLEDVAAWAWELGFDVDVALGMVLVISDRLPSSILADLCVQVPPKLHTP